MKKKLSIYGISLAITGLVFGMTSPNNVLALTTAQLALSNSGSQSGISNDQYMTPDGKYILFVSGADYIVSNDNNNKQDLFIRNIDEESTTRVSVSSNGTEANGNSVPIKISNNGRYVLFTSFATNLVDTSAMTHYTHGLFLHDTLTGSTELIDWGTGGSLHVGIGDISEDARFVYYQKTGTPSWRIYKKDRLLNTTTEVGTDASGNPQTTGENQGIRTTCDGRFIVFQSNATDLVSGDSNGEWDIFLVDTFGTSSIKNLTINSNGHNSNPTISCDGNFVTFSSDADNLVGDDTNNSSDLFIYNVSQSLLQRGSLDDGGIEFSSYVSGRNALSYDGRYFAFEAYSSSSPSVNLIYVRDIKTNETKLISKNSSNQAADKSSNLHGMTYDGKTVLYQSYATNMGVANPNNKLHLFKATDY